MDLSSVFQLFILWAHAMAAVAWIGGSLFYLIALEPAISRVGRTPERLELLAAVGREFREVVRLAILVFVVSGAILAVTRLSQPRVSVAYAAVLALKVAVSVWMFWLAGRLASPAPGKPVKNPAEMSRPRWLRPQYLILELGALVYLLSLLLRVLFEQSLGPAP